jgi:hypothetical protein
MTDQTQTILLEAARQLALFGGTQPNLVTPAKAGGPFGLAGFHIAVGMDASLCWHDGETWGVVTIRVLRTPL